MKFSYTSLFHRSFKGLTAQQQEQIESAIKRFENHHQPPFPAGWRVHKLKGVKGTPAKEGDPPPDIWEMHAPGSGALILTFQRGSDEVMFRNCGLHDETLQNP